MTRKRKLFFKTQGRIQFESAPKVLKGKKIDEDVTWAKLSVGDFTCGQIMANSRLKIVWLTLLLRETSAARFIFDDINKAYRFLEKCEFEVNRSTKNQNEAWAELVNFPEISIHVVKEEKYESSNSRQP